MIPHSFHWNTDASQFFTTAVETSSSPINLQDAAFLKSATERQESLENHQDLVLHRTCYFDVNKTRRTTQSTPDAVLATFADSQSSSKEVTIHQLYVAFWPAACLAAMIYILLQFVLFYRGTGNGINGIGWTESSMTKHSAMLLTCVYAALAWTLSNGLVLNPRKNLF